MFDATNSTAERRKMIHDIVVNKWGYKLFFVESICDDPLIIEQNIMVNIAHYLHLYTIYSYVNIFYFISSLLYLF